MRPAGTWALVGTLLLAALLIGSASGAKRVVGGSAIGVQSAPWAVFVQNRGSIEYDDCSGTIIDPLHVLTAAHCVFDSAGNLARPSQFSVKAGVSNLSTPVASDAEQDRAVSSFTVHPGYVNSETPGPDDVALLALGSPLDLSGPAVKPVALPAQAAPYPAGAAVGVAGFGVESVGTAPNGQLNWMTGTVDAQGACGAGRIIDDDAVRLCASSPASSTCQGDSGGGLVTTGSNPTLVGVLSAGPPGCAAGSHSVFSYVGAPEVWAFINGNQQPPTAPREGDATFVRINWESPLTVGTTLTCTTGGWTAGATFTYAFVNAQTGQVLQSGTSSTFVPSAADVHDTVACTGFATNAGGTASATTKATPSIAAAPQTGKKTTKPAPTSGTQPPPPTGSITARAYNSKTITEKAQAIPSPPVKSGKWVDVPQWDGYLRLALIENRKYGGSAYRDTYVRCWSNAAWTKAPSAGQLSFEAKTTLLGFYTRGSSWVNVPVSTCANAAKAARGQLETTSVVALGTILRETFNRQGVADTNNATCLGAIGTWQAIDREKGSGPANRAWRLLLNWYSSHLDTKSLGAFRACVTSSNSSLSG